MPNGGMLETFRGTGTEVGRNVDDPGLRVAETLRGTGVDWTRCGTDMVGIGRNVGDGTCTGAAGAR
jgi:hypothetical protein